MRQLTRLCALTTCLLLLSAPAVRACDELTGAMLGCSRVEAAEASMGASMGAGCHEDARASMDCCLAHPNPEPEQAIGLDSDRGLSRLELPSRVPTETLAVARHPVASDASLSDWRVQERYILFSSYLI